MTQDEFRNQLSTRQSGLLDEILDEIPAEAPLKLEKQAVRIRVKFGYESFIEALESDDIEFAAKFRWLILTGLSALEEVEEEL